MINNKNQRKSTKITKNQWRSTVCSVMFGYVRLCSVMFGYVRLALFCLVSGRWLCPPCWFACAPHCKTWLLNMSRAFIALCLQSYCPGLPCLTGHCKTLLLNMSRALIALCLQSYTLYDNRMHVNIRHSRVSQVFVLCFCCCVFVCCFCLVCFFFFFFCFVWQASHIGWLWGYYRVIYIVYI